MSGLAGWLVLLHERREVRAKRVKKKKRWLVVFRFEERRKGVEGDVYLKKKKKLGKKWTVWAVVITDVRATDRSRTGCKGRKNGIKKEGRKEGRKRMSER